MRGFDGYLDMLTAQRTFYSTRQSLIVARLNKSTTVVVRYKVPGGALADHTGT